MTNDNRDLGTLVKLEGRDAVRYERVYPHAPERVWRALIEPGSIKSRWPRARTRSRCKALRRSFGITRPYVR